MALFYAYNSFERIIYMKINIYYRENNSFFS